MAAAHVARAIGTAVMFLTLALPACAALPDEVRAYASDINTPGEFGLELRINVTPSGIGIPSYPGKVMTSYGQRATAEFSYGLAPSLELGLYVPITLMCEDAFYMIDLKVWVKWVPMHLVDGIGNLADIDVELAHVVGRFEVSQNTAELRPIYGYQNDHWLWAVNPMLDWNLSGDGRSGVPEAAPSFKTAQTVATGARAGMKYYAGLGLINHIAPLHEQRHMVLLAFDIDHKLFVFSPGAGRDLIRASDRWTLKWIFEILLS